MRLEERRWRARTCIRVRLPPGLPVELEVLVRQADGDRATRAAVGDGHLKVVDEAALRARPLGAHCAHVLRVITAADVANGQLVLADGQEARVVDRVELGRERL